MSISNFYQISRYHKINDYRKEAIIRFIGFSANPVILDIGCAYGLLGAEFKKRTSCQFYGADISNKAITEAKQVLNNAWQVNLEEDFLNWPEELKGKEYDVVIISELLEHLFEPEKLLLNLKKLAKHDKFIIITVPNLLFWKNRLKIMLGQFNYTDQGVMDRGHIHFFTWVSFKKMIQEAGYKIVAVDNHFPTRGTKWFGQFWPGLFAYRFIVKIVIDK